MHETNKTHFHSVLSKLTEAGRFPEEGYVDEAITEYVGFIDCYC